MQGANFLVDAYQHHKFDIKLKEILQKEYSSTKTEDLASKYGYSAKTMLQGLAYLGLELRDKGWAEFSSSKYVLNQTIDELGGKEAFLKLLVEQRSILNIARILKIDKCALSKYAKEIGLRYFPKGKIWKYKGKEVVRQ